MRNALRLVSHRLKRAKLPIRFQSGNVFREIEADLSAGRLKHREHDWLDTLKLAEDLSSSYTEALGSAAVDLWHVATAIVPEADTFWTFDGEQQALARPENLPRQEDRAFAGPLYIPPQAVSLIASEPRTALGAARESMH